jgi:hypothetical protein
MMRPSLEDVVERALMPPMRCVEIVKPGAIEPLRGLELIELPQLRIAMPGLCATLLALFALACAGSALRGTLSKIEFRLVSTSQPYQAGRPGVSAANPRQAGTIATRGGSTNER